MSFEFLQSFLTGHDEVDAKHRRRYRREMQHVLYALFVLGLALACPNRAFAEQVSLTTGNNYPPYTDENLPGGGLDTVIIRRIFTEMGLDPTFSFLPWKRGYEDTKDAHFVGTFPYKRTAEREKDFLYSAPINEISSFIFINLEHPFKFDSFNDLIGRTTCRPIGYTLGKDIDLLEDEGKISIVVPKSITQCFLMLRNNRLDFIAVNEFAGWSSAISALGADARKHIVMLPKPFSTFTLHFIVPKSYAGGEDLIRDFNVKLNDLIEMGVIKEINDAYFESYIGSK